jgi:hypothetical protein
MFYVVNKHTYLLNKFKMKPNIEKNNISVLDFIYKNFICLIKKLN